MIFLLLFTQLNNSQNWSEVNLTGVYPVKFLAREQRSAFNRGLPLKKPEY